MKFKSLFFWIAAMMLVTGFSGCDIEEEDGGYFFDGPVEMLETGQNDYAAEETPPEVAGRGGPSSFEPNIIRNLPTGQIRCYDNLSEIPCPEPGERYFGQDANYSQRPKVFIDNGNETVTDGDTGYIWQQGSKSEVTWYEANSYCETLTLNARKWRLPTPTELRTLVDYGISDPAIDPVSFPDTPSDWFWASKHSYFNDVSLGEESSWIINFFDGYVDYTSRYNVYNVRCIRAN